MILRTLQEHHKSRKRKILEDGENFNTTSNRNFQYSTDITSNDSKKSNLNTQFMQLHA